MAPGTSSMLRARRKDVNAKPNRVLDRGSSRGMIYENEELRLRTININAEVEKGINDIKKLRRENDQLRREIWNLRDEYDRLEALYKAKHVSTDEEEEEEEGEDEEEEDEEDEEENSEETETQQKGDATQDKSGEDVLSVVEEEPEDISDNGDDRPKTVSFREETLRVPGSPQAVEPVPPANWPDNTFIPGPQLAVPLVFPDNPAQTFPGDLHSFFRDVSGEHLDKVLTPGGSEVVTTAILQRRQSYTHTGDQTKDTFTCATSQHTTPSSGAYPYSSLPPADPPDGYPPSTECEAYSGPAPCFLRLNGVQPFTLVFPINEPSLHNLSVQEVIDSLSEQLSGPLMHSLRGVRLVGGSCYLSFSEQQDADAALTKALTLRGVPLHLEDASEGTTILSLAGVPHDLPDEAVATVLSHFGSLVGPVERRVYKGVDTGERLVRLRARLAIPRWIWLDGCRVCLKTVRSEDIVNQHMTRRKSFKSHINVQLKPIVDTEVPASTTSSPFSTPPPKNSLPNTNPFICGSVPSIPIPTTPGSQLPYLNNTSVSTPNIFQESPFLFPSQFQSPDPSGLRRINSVMGTMSLGNTQDGYPPRSASSPPGATTSATGSSKYTNEERTETTGQTSIPPSPNAPRKTPQRHKASRKISKMSTDSRKTNGETSSSDQDSPNKPGRRRPSTVNFKQKPILNRNLSTDQDGTGYEATCSERERSNSDLSSRQSICKRKLSTTGRESGKVPWCGCWGNGCL